MDISLEDPIFDELQTFHKMYMDLKLGSVCSFISAVFATHYTTYKSRLFIIDSANHSVVYDGKNTWDLGVGIVLHNYQYPNFNPPEPNIIPAFNTHYKREYFEEFYSNNALTIARTAMAIKELKFIGEKVASKKEN